MGLSLAETNEAAAHVFDMAEAVRPGTLAQCAGDVPGALDSTLNVQPCLFVTDLAAAAALHSRGIVPDVVAGFSLGEIPALAFAGVMDMEAAFRLVLIRAEAIQKCAEANPGGMAAVLGLDAAAVEAACEATGAYPVNYNCPGQIVIAGTAETLARAAGALKQAGGRVMPLKVSGAFHAPYMAEAEAALAAHLAGEPLSPPRVPLFSNVTGLPYEPPYAPLIARQAASPVRFMDTLLRMADMGVTAFVEVGVGATLSGLVRKTVPGALALSVEDPESLEKALDALAGQ